jgi:hypothetical protein
MQTNLTACSKERERESERSDNKKGKDNGRELERVY